MLYRSIIRFSWFAFLLPALAMAGEPAPIDQARLTVILPVYVAHPDARQEPGGWNEGWFHNEGALIDASWPIRKLGAATRLRAGFTAGGFDNSTYRTSFFLGGMAEIEHFATERLAFNLGMYAAAITGYDDGLEPALAPYAGASYAVTEKMELGARGFWLPARTLGGGDMGDSDAYVGTITMGTRF